MNRHAAVSGGRVRKVLWVLLGVVVVLAIAVAALLIRLNSSFDSVQTMQSAFPEDADRPVATETESGSPMNVLLLGTDSRETGQDLLDNLGDRADAILVAHIPPDRESVQIMSIMRDSWVEIPGYGHSKVNAAMAHGGVPLTVETVENLIDQRIDHVAVVDFNGFQNITDALGGVEVNNPRAFSYDGQQFQQGPITLNGDQALTFVRSRNFEDGDYTRVENQQLFMKSMAGEVLSRDTLTSPGKLNDLVEATTPYVAMDGDFGVGTMVGMGTSMSSVRAGDITSFTLPTAGIGTEGGGQSVVYVDWDELEEVQERFKNDELADYQPDPR